MKSIILACVLVLTDARELTQNGILVANSDLAQNEIEMEKQIAAYKALKSMEEKK